MEVCSGISVIRWSVRFNKLSEIIGGFNIISDTPFVIDNMKLREMEHGFYEYRNIFLTMLYFYSTKGVFVKRF